MTDTGRAVCGTCQHWAQGKGYWANEAVERKWNGAEERGECRRTPPAVFYDQGIQIPSTYWPETHSDQWCSEHEKGQGTP